MDRTGSSYTSITNGFSMIISFFLLVMGAYYLGKYFFKLSDSNTLKLLALVITIIVFLSETCLLLLSFHKEDMRRQKEGIRTGRNTYYSESFAYKLNKAYRNNVNNRYNRSFKRKQE